MPKLRRSYAIYIALGLIILSTAFAGIMSLRSAARINELHHQWQDYFLIAQEKGTALGDLKEAVGYDGFIHNFKNYILRGTEDYSERTEKSYNAALALISLYETYDLAPAEQAALAESRNTVSEYVGNLAVARQMRSEGATIADIDQVVKIDDKPMQAALETLKVHWLATYSDGLEKLDNLLTKARDEAAIWLSSLGLSFLAMIGSLLVAVRFQRDIVRTREQLSVTNTRLQAILDSSGEPIIILNAAGEIESYNQATADTLGLGTEQLLGQHISTLQPEPDNLDWRAALDIERGTTGLKKAKTLLLDVQRKSGPLLIAEVNISSFFVGEIKGFVVILRDVTERQRTEEALLQAKLESEETLKNSQSYFANISHELRTPLNAILGFSQVLMRDDLPKKAGPQQSQEYATYIHTAGEHLLKLVTEILDISKISQGKFTLRKEEVQVQHVINDALVLAKRLANDKGIILEESIHCAEDVVEWDIMRMVQVLLNILGNAIKFTEPGGTVTFACEAKQGPSGHWVEITVSDSGHGIPSHEIKNIFRPFVQAAHTVSDLGAGTGLGLPLAKFLVDLHGGEINLKSTIGEGTSVTIKMPQ